MRLQLWLQTLRVRLELLDELRGQLVLLSLNILTLNGLLKKLDQKFEGLVLD